MQIADENWTTLTSADWLRWNEAVAWIMWGTDDALHRAADSGKTAVRDSAVLSMYDLDLFALNAPPLMDQNQAEQRLLGLLASGEALARGRQNLLDQPVNIDRGIWRMADVGMDDDCFTIGPRELKGRGWFIDFVIQFGADSAATGPAAQTMRARGGDQKLQDWAKAAVERKVSINDARADAVRVLGDAAPEREVCRQTLRRVRGEHGFVTAPGRPVGSKSFQKPKPN